MLKLAIKHRIQLDNSLYPYGSCNATSVAMVVDFCTGLESVPGVIESQPYVQFEDKLLSYLDAMHLDRHDHEALKMLMEQCGVKDEFRADATAADIRAHLDRGYPCISAGFYTNEGHIVVIGGYTPTGFVVFDPYGEWCADGYLRNYGDSALGDGYELSYGTWEALNMDAVGAWVHFCEPA